MRPSPGASTAAVKVVAFVVVLGGLYLAQAVLLPVAIAVLLAYVLMPIVALLERWTRRRWAAVAIAVSLSAAILIGGVFVTVIQARDWVERLPEYRLALSERLKTVRAGGAFIERAVHELQGVAQETTGKSAEPVVAAPPPPEESEAPPMPPRPAAGGSLGWVPALLRGAGVVFITALMATVILLYREDLRDRLIRLLGVDRLVLTHQVLDQASQRVSRYLLAQVMVNAGFGAIVGTGLALASIPNALLIGIASGLLRFIPYIGPITATAIGLLTTAAAVPGMGSLLGVLGIFVLAETLAAAVAEPWLYGRHAGLSPLGVVIALVFWGWLWGIAGMLVAVPLTVCVALLGRHFSALAPLAVLLGDEPALTAADRFHHRLLSGDAEGARAILEETAKTEDATHVADALWLPSLRRAAREFQHEDMPAQPMENYYSSAESLLARPEAPAVSPEALANPGADPDAPESRPVVIVSPPTRLDYLTAMVARDAIDSAAGVRLLDPAVMVSEFASSESGASARAVVVVGIKNASARRVRLLARGFHTRLPTAQVLIADLTGPHPDRQSGAGASGIRTVATVQELREALGVAHPPQLASDMPVPSVAESPTAAPPSPTATAAGPTSRPAASARPRAA